MKLLKLKKYLILDYKKIDILIHPKSYIHAIVKFKNGINKIIAHEPDMKIPIFNTLNVDNQIKKINKKNIKIK